MIEFLSSLGVVGYFVVGVVVVAVWNMKKLIFLRSPLDRQQHKNWRATGGATDPDHLPRNDDHTDK